jgi:hypothetical protein
MTNTPDDTNGPAYVECASWPDGTPCVALAGFTDNDDGMRYLVDDDGSFVPVDMRD